MDNAVTTMVTMTVTVLTRARTKPRTGG